MNLLEELRAASIELAMETPITQERWSSALVEGWQNSRTLGWAIFRAAGVVGPLDSHHWDRLIEQIQRLVPSVSPYTHLKNNLRAWIASNARFASDALWDGRVEDAKRLMAKGGYRESGRRQNKREAVEANKDLRGSIAVSARSLDRRHDWKTVK